MLHILVNIFIILYKSPPGASCGGSDGQQTSLYFGVSHSVISTVDRVSERPWSELSVCD